MAWPATCERTPSAIEAVIANSAPNVRRGPLQDLGGRGVLEVASGPGRELLQGGELLRAALRRDEGLGHAFTTSPTSDTWKTRAHGRHSHAA